MPISRLNPRSSQSRMAVQKTRKATSGAQRHLQLWAAIKNTRDELNNWQLKIEQVESLFVKHIEPLERQLHSTASNLTDQLIELFSIAELSIADQSLLGLWINENLNSLQDHPFGEASRHSELRSKWLERLRHDGPVENQLSRLAQKHQADNTSDTAQFDDAATEDNDDDEILFDFGMHSRQDKKTNRQSEKSESSINKEQEKQHPRDNSDQQKEQDAKLSASSIDDTVASLEDKLSVERIFRQLAKVLHPDREQEETVKAAKNDLMSQCLEARNSNDINTLLTLYCEHVGELPDDLDQNSHLELVKALEMQLKALQQELREKRFGDPLQALIVERYASSNEADCKRRMDKHASSLNTEIKSVERLIVDVKSPEGLNEALVTRRAIELDKMAIDEMTGK